MGAGNPSLSTVFSCIDRVVSSLHGERDAADVAECLRLVQALVARLPHKYLPAATSAEIRATEKLLLREGFSRRDLKLLRSTLAALFDQLVLIRALRWHPLRGEDREHANPVSVPATGLAVSLPPSVERAVEEVVEPLGFAIHRETSAEQGLDRARWFPFDFVVCGFPIEAPAWFLETLRADGTLCRSAGVVLLCEERRLEQAAIHLGRGANRVLALSELEHRLGDLVIELDQVSERVRLRIPVQVERRSGRTADSWRSENISRTGMLLRTTSRTRVGSLVELGFRLPRTTRPVHVSARVVRATTFGREDFSGYGVSFLAFSGDGQFRLERFLQ